MSKKINFILGFFLISTLANAEPPGGKGPNKDSGPAYKVPLLFDANDEAIGVVDVGPNAYILMNIAGLDRLLRYNNSGQFWKDGTQFYYVGDDCSGVPYMGQGGFSTKWNIGYTSDPEALPVSFTPRKYRISSNADQSASCLSYPGGPLSLLPAIQVIDFGIFVLPFQTKVTY